MPFFHLSNHRDIWWQTPFSQCASVARQIQTTLVNSYSLLSSNNK
jgi:hypothetical protein